VYAEDPFRGFLPSVGRLVRYLPPAESANVRVDTGVYEGGEVSIHYDPMIAKLITHGPTRREAIAHLRNALNEFTIRGVSHNISFLGALVDHPRFAAGELSTNFIAEEFPLGFNAADVIHDEPGLLIATVATIHRRYRERAARISGQLEGYEPQVEKDWFVLLGVHTANESRHSVTVVPSATDDIFAYDVTYRDAHYRVETAWQFGQPLFRARINDIDVCMQVERRHLVYRLIHWGTQTDALVLSARAAELLSRMPAKEPAQSTKYLLSPMPGLLSKVVVAAGQDVKAGQDLAVIEAMKMENVLRADREAKVRKLLAGVGESLAVDQPILEFE
jgi:propionyl-CoA carboxylase alpha chain